MLDQLQNDGDIEQTTPTIGFNVEVLQYKNIKFQVWDVNNRLRLEKIITLRELQSY